MKIRVKHGDSRCKACLVATPGGGISFDGNTYSALPSSDVTLTTVAEPGAFASGTVNGADLQFSVIPGTQLRQPAPVWLWRRTRPPALPAPAAGLSNVVDFTTS